jgi:tetratricopeptide (TPR) repeat protein
MDAAPPVSAELLERVRALGAAGDYPGVVRLLEPVPRSALLTEPELGYHLAYAWRRVGRTADALALTEALSRPVRRGASAWLIRRRLNLEAMLRFDHGDVPSAEQLWAEVVEHASVADDQQLLAAALNNLGIVLTLQDRIDAALAVYNRALLASRRLGDRRLMAQAHQNIAIVYRELGRPEEASTHFEQALSEARRAGSEDVRGRVEEERALLMLESGDAPLAAATARRALDRLEAIADLHGQGEALRVLGIVALHEQRSSDARGYLERALALALQGHNALLEAETREGLAVLADREGSPATAARERRRATARFAAMRAQPWGVRIRARTAALTER